MTITKEIEGRIRQTYTITDLKIIDESHKHIGHSGHRPEGESHFRIKIISPDFKSMSRINRHRHVHNLLDDLLKTRIHALSLDLKDQ